MLPVTAHPEFGLRYLHGIWSYQLKVESMKHLLLVYQIQERTVSVTMPMDMTRGSMDSESGPTNATSTCVFGAL